LSSYSTYDFDALSITSLFVCIEYEYPAKQWHYTSWTTRCRCDRWTWTWKWRSITAGDDIYCTMFHVILRYVPWAAAKIHQTI
jgi:hypothetical protein